MVAPTVLFVVSIGAWWWAVRARLPHPECCVACGYLVGDAEGKVCSECGTIVEEAVTRDRAERSWWRRWVLLLFLLSLMSHGMSVAASRILPLSQTFVDVPFTDMTITPRIQIEGVPRYELMIEHPAPDLRDQTIDPNELRIPSRLSCTFGDAHHGVSKGGTVVFPRGDDVNVDARALERWFQEDLGIELSAWMCGELAQQLMVLEMPPFTFDLPPGLSSKFNRRMTRGSGIRAYTQPPRWTAGPVFMIGLLPLIIFIMSWWQMSLRRGGPIDDRAECAGWYVAGFGVDALLGMAVLAAFDVNVTMTWSWVVTLWMGRLLLRRNQTARAFTVVAMSIILVLFVIGLVAVPMTHELGSTVSIGTVTIREPEPAMMYAVFLPMLVSAGFLLVLLRGSSARRQFDEWLEARIVNRDEEIVEMLLERDRARVGEDGE